MNTKNQQKQRKAKFSNRDLIENIKEEVALR